MVFKRILFFFPSLLLVASVISSELRHILPLDLKIRDGEDLQLRLTSILPGAVSCYVKTPSLTSYNLISKESDNNRINYWTENGECGVRVKDVTKEDAGRWRLTAKNATSTLVNSVLVQVLDKANVPEQNLTIESGLGYTLTLDDESKYCRIKQPHSENTISVSGQCQVDLNQPTAAVEGTWSAVTGVVGQLKEVIAAAELNVVRDRLVTGFIRNVDADTISAYCNLRDADTGLEFCRFAKPDKANTGFQLSEGLHSGRYGYYGAGLYKGECGITIETPSAEDYGQWLCSVAVKGEESFGSFVQIHDSNRHDAISRVSAEALPTNAATSTLGQKLQLRCETNVPISYCRFVGPDGETFRPSQSVTETNDLYRYIGDGFGKGQCGIEIASAEAKHTGRWTCHMGPQVPGFEVFSTIEVRVTDTPLAATNTRITVAEGETLTIGCRTVPERISIEYCRFLMPDGTGIHIEDDVTEANPLVLNNIRYWFSGTSVRLGDCGLKVDRISSQHLGEWTCAAQLEHGGNSEAFDIITVSPGEAFAHDDLENSTAAAMAGIATGVVLLVLILAGGSIYVVKKFKARLLQFNDGGMEIVSIPSNSRRSSTSTNSTGSAQAIMPSNTRA